MKKSLTIIGMIILLLAMFFVMLYYFNIKANDVVKVDYDFYYQHCLYVSKTENINISGLQVDSQPYALYKSCIDSGGCFMGCGSACPPSKDKISLVKTFSYVFEEDKGCIDLCVPQCVCPYKADLFNNKCAWPGK